MMFSKLFKKESNVSMESQDCNETAWTLPWTELPGYSEPSIEDLNFEVFNFERSVKRFLESKGQRTNKDLEPLIEDMRAFPPSAEYQIQWDIRINQMQELRKIRNKIIHNEFGKLEKVIENAEFLKFDAPNNFKTIYSYFREINRVLIPFKICSGNMSRFEFERFDNELFYFSVDNQLLSLSVDDIYNLECELGIDHRGKVNFNRGRLVVGKVQSFSYESVTYYIEDFEPFTLTFDEMAVFSDFLGNMIETHSSHAFVN